MCVFRSLLATLLAAFLCVGASFGAVTKTDSGTPSSVLATAGTQLDLTTFTVTAGSSCLIAMLTTNNTITSPSLNWDNAGTPQAMTSAGSIQNTVRDQMFYLVNPTSGNKTLRATWTTSRIAVLGAIAFTGTDTTTCINTANTATNIATSAAPTVTVTSTAAGGTVAMCGTTTADPTGTTTFTQIYLRNGTNRGVASYGLGGTSNAHNFTASASIAWACMGVNVIAAVSCVPSLSLLGVGRCGI